MTGTESLFSALRRRLVARRVGIKAARASCSAEAKRANRYLRRVHALEGAIDKHKEQAKHDQAYIDALERMLTSEQIQWAKDEVTPF